MILFDWLKRQAWKVRNKYFVMQSRIFSDFFIDNFMEEKQEKIVASPSRAFADIGRYFVCGYTSGHQEATLKTIHQMPKVPYQLWTKPYFDDDPRTPSEFWEWWNS